MHPPTLGLTVSLPVMGLLFFGAVILALLLLARATPGSGADLVDWNPAERAEARQGLEHEDIGQLLEATNRRRRARGEAELTEHEVLRDLRSSD